MLKGDNARGNASCNQAIALKCPAQRQMSAMAMLRQSHAKAHFTVSNLHKE